MRNWLPIDNAVPYFLLLATMKKKYGKPTVETVRIDAPNVLFSGSPDDDDELFSRGGNGPGSHGKACEHGSHWFCD